ncbi:hypothetical protein [Diatraea saccharalis granulovirus]|uniref:Uncharacterized protein n=1 Tax=Diatraea saccharalis granulovirus TaxID=1675862 RepID=A0A0R7EZ20_9BBAC|nr:hypothetical protein [Diatraea saccharalis granulovirus]AKN80824.1 hypothetical protein [Diatraea saccharalis granulovirus]
MNNPPELTSILSTSILPTNDKNFNSEMEIEEEEEEKEYYGSKTILLFMNEFTKYTNNKNIFLAKVPPLNGFKSLQETQTALNTYLLYTLKGNKNAYRLLQFPGQRCVAYYYIVRYLISQNIIDGELRVICKEMYKMYKSWCDQVPALYPLVINLNGADPTKEIMSIVNQSVYSMVKFIVNVLLNNNIPDYLYEVDYKPNEDYWQNISHDIDTDNVHLTFIFDSKLMSINKNVDKYYNYDKETPTKFMNHLELIKLSSPNVIKSTFVVEK